LGEYIGVVKKSGEGGGEYTAMLEDLPHYQGLMVDAMARGNEGTYPSSSFLSLLF
jgi:hypothetical protein